MVAMATTSFAVTSSALSVRSARALPAITPSRQPLRTAFSRRASAGARGPARRTIAVQAKQFDFDEFLAEMQDKFESSENKPVVVGYGVGALIAFFFTERLINGPVFNIFLGWPLQTLGLLVAPYLAVRYLKDGEDWYADASDALDKVVKTLPGLKK